MNGISLSLTTEPLLKPQFSAEKTPESPAAKRIANGGCETCKNRKYVDVSNEGDVSFQTPSHIAPGASASAVGAHEREHVSNAIQKSKQPGAVLVQASVRLISSVCPECGRRYVSGGVTNTTIRYTKNPYDQTRKAADAAILTGNTVDETA